MRLSWNEIRIRAAAFAKDWEGQGYEKGQTQLFYRDLFEVFGMPIRRVASFEEPVKRLGDKRGYIDLFWPGVLLVEQKSAGRDLKVAKQQALDYFPGLQDAQLPRYLLLSDFQTFELYDLDEGEAHAFALKDLAKNVERFAFILGIQKRAFRDQDPVNVKVAAKVGLLHDALEESGYTGRDLEQYLVRLVFCMFADDTGIFEPRGTFSEFLETRTSSDGADLGGWLGQLFQVLDTPEAKRLKNLDEDLARFPYINGSLFKSVLPLPSFTAEMRQRLIDASAADWSNISPAIFGSLFQSVMDAKERRALGAHYTTEKNIMKVIEPLFLDGLRAEFDRIRIRKSNGRQTALQEFQRKLGRLKFFDPACGAGNFLIIAYRELRVLELEVIRLLWPGRVTEQMELDATELSLVNVDQFYGIEIGDFASRIAETALWMMDHLMNNRLSLEFGQSYVRIPLRRSPHIVHGNALRIDWNAVLPAADCQYVFGNPPFIGHQWRSEEQQEDMHRTWGRSGQVNRLDYVTCWFKRAVEYATLNPAIEVAFVSTNSVTQGEQVGILWPALFAAGAHIRFAHRTFRWNSEARGTAAVHCVIVGLSQQPPTVCHIYDYDDIQGDPHVVEVSRINGYLIEGPQYSVPARSKPPAGLPQMFKGSQPTDGARVKEGNKYFTYSNLILDDQDKHNLLVSEPRAAKWLKPYVGGDELISGHYRWCLWLKGSDPSELAKCPEIQTRLKRVRANRLKSPTESVRDYSKYPSLFTQDRQPDINYLAVPEVSSENREYVPMAMLSPNIIASNKLQIIPGATLYHFGILTSAMHMAWMRTVAGRLKSDYSYSPAVYNSFPWPNATAAQQKVITALAAKVLKVRASFRSSTLEVLYDPDSMPPALRKAHQDLDMAVDKLYRRSRFRFERERVEHLFALFESVVVPLAPAVKRAMKKRRPKKR